MGARVFEFLDYRAFLKSAIEEAKAQGIFSARIFARKADFKSCGFLPMVLKGQRNLSQESARKIAKFFKLTRAETNFFCELVEFNQCQNLEKKDLLYQKILSFRKFQESKPLAADQYVILNQWHTLMILEAVESPLMREPVDRIAEQLNLKVSQVQESFQVLENLGLIKRESGFWVKTGALLSTPVEVQSLAIRNFHRQMISRALESLDTVAQEKRHANSLTIAITKQKYQDISNRLFEFQNELNRIFTGDEDPDAVYQLNFQLFPLAELKAG